MHFKVYPFIGNNEPIDYFIFMEMIIQFGFVDFIFRKVFPFSKAMVGLEGDRVGD